MSAWRTDAAERQRAQMLGDVVWLLQSTKETYFDFAAIDVLPSSCEIPCGVNGDDFALLSYESGWSMSGEFGQVNGGLELVWFILSWTSDSRVRSLMLTGNEVSALNAADDFVREKILSGFAHSFAELDARARAS